MSTRTHVEIGVQQSEVLNQVKALVDEQKREISILYSELKLRLPTYLKSVTIEELRLAGVGVYPDIGIPKDVEERLRKYVSIRDRLKEIGESFKTQVIDYFASLKKKLPEELKKKQLESLDDNEWEILSIDPALVRRQFPRD